MRASFLALRALLMKSMSLTDKRVKFALLLFMICPDILNTRLLAVLVAITRNVFLARSLRAGNSNL